MFLEWIKHGVARQDNNAELIRSFNKDVFPILKDIPIRKITETHIKSVYTSIAQRKSKLQTRERTIIRLSNDIRQLFKWAEIRKPWRQLLIDGNPTLLINIDTFISKDYTEQRDRVLSEKEIKKLHSILSHSHSPIPSTSNCAIWLCLSTMCRIGELIKARWEHINLEEKVWFIPKENVKATNGKKQDHRIYLSDFAIKYFQLLYSETGETEWCFPSRDKQNHRDLKSISKIIGDRQIQFKERNQSNGRVYNNALVIGSGAWTLHDLRRTGATIMQELGINLDVIDRCQNHILSGSKIRRHYMKYDYKKEMTEAWGKLGEFIQKAT